MKRKHNEGMFSSSKFAAMWMHSVPLVHELDPDNNFILFDASTRGLKAIEGTEIVPGWLHSHGQLWTFIQDTDHGQFREGSITDVNRQTSHRCHSRDSVYHAMRENTRSQQKVNQMGAAVQ